MADSGCLSKIQKSKLYDKNYDFYIINISNDLSTFCFENFTIF